MLHTYANIILPLAVPKNYTWLVPTHLQVQIAIGQRVEVSLRNKKYTGIVAEIHQSTPEAFTPKEIISIIDPTPIISQTQLTLWQWIANYYMCTQGDVMSAALPSYYKLNSESILVHNPDYGEDYSLLNNDEYIVAEALLIKNELKLSEVKQLLDGKKIYAVINQLAYKKVCYIWEGLKDKYKAKQETYVLLNPTYNNETNLSNLLNNWQKAPKQMELLLAYLHLIKSEGQVTKKNLLLKATATDAQLKGLTEKNIVQLVKRNETRLAQLPKNVAIDFELSTAQNIALAAINTSFQNKKNCLLHGVTSSGKTQIYIKLIEEAVKKGQQVLYLVPEIALTAQLITRLQRHFGGNIAVYHSRCTDNERVELWQNVQSGNTKIMMGARSALLLPYQNLGLIIIDEEHEPSYKQYEPAPRYHARDTALYYANLLKANVVLGSATPSIETYYNAQQHKITLVPLTERYAGIELPAITIVNTALANKGQREKVIITPELQAAIQVALAHNKQVILYKNRRGYTPYKNCSTCGWIPQCKHCNVALTYHKQRNQLICHTCNTIYSSINTCTACGGQKFEQKNFGTEKIEEAITALFPTTKIARMDTDTIKGKDGHSKIITAFEQGKIQLLIGTQMVVKGLDFENVQLVGIVDADSILGFADFRVNERAYQQMEQVSGRAGRKHSQGSVIIQALQSHHSVLQYVQQHNYLGMYNKEIQEREQFYYPPYTRLIHIQFKHKNQITLNLATHYFITHIGTAYMPYVIGPTSPFVNRVRNQYLEDILFKLPKNTTLINNCKAAITQQIAILQNTAQFSSTVIIINVDPV